MLGPVCGDINSKFAPPTSAKPTRKVNGEGSQFTKQCSGAIVQRFQVTESVFANFSADFSKSFTKTHVWCNVAEFDTGIFFYL